MAGNIRNQRTTHPRKQQRRQRALTFFKVRKDMLDNGQYLKNKQVEFFALGGSPAAFERLIG